MLVGLMFIRIMYIASVCTSQKTQSLSIIKISLLMQHKEIGDIYCENNTKNINTLCGKMQGFLIFW
jgi:hypothetical protein